ncbi:MAG: hypothetical protein EA350_14690 [Gemmatimonadales bacterium]|nr:MAG: hypothetical protein EA350_14690 [Gemmatimonadales bacterium]
MKLPMERPALDRLDRSISGTLRLWGMPALQLSLGIVFIWFGALKLFDLSPAADLIRNTVYWWDPAVFLPILGIWEIVIGICLLVRPLVRVAIPLLLLQMPGTMLPLVLLPEVCFTHPPFGLTLEGQYIVKNLVLVAAALVVGGSLRDREFRGEILPGWRPRRGPRG